MESCHVHLADTGIILWGSQTKDPAFPNDRNNNIIKK